MRGLIACKLAWMSSSANYVKTIVRYVLEAAAE